MKKDNNKAYMPMPEKMYLEAAERQEREKIYGLSQTLQSYVTKFREAGVSIESADELRQLTPTAIRDQIAETRKRRLGERFLPAAIRQSEEKEFARMEKTLVPLAENLQETLKAIHFDIYFDKGELWFDADAVEDSIEKASQIEVPSDIRAYYDRLQEVVKAWSDLCQWCKDNHLTVPTHSVLQAMCDYDPNTPSHLQPCKFSLTPERMFSLWQYGIISRV